MPVTQAAKQANNRRSLRKKGIPCLPDTSPRHIDIPRIALRAMAGFGTSRIILRAKYCGSRVAGRADNYSVMSKIEVRNEPTLLVGKTPA
jgi:hypothetical protein